MSPPCSLTVPGAVPSKRIFSLLLLPIHWVVCQLCAKDNHCWVPGRLGRQLNCFSEKCLYLGILHRLAQAKSHSFALPNSGKDSNCPVQSRREENKALSPFSLLPGYNNVLKSLLSTPVPFPYMFPVCCSHSILYQLSEYSCHPACKCPVTFLPPQLLLLKTWKPVLLSTLSHMWLLKIEKGESFTTCSQGKRL